MGLIWEPCKDQFKDSNEKWVSLDGIATNVPVKLGQWIGMTTFTIILMDDYTVVFGMKFIDNLKLIMVPHENTMRITQERAHCVVNVSRENEVSLQ